MKAKQIFQGYSAQGSCLCSNNPQFAFLQHSSTMFVVVNCSLPASRLQKIPSVPPGFLGCGHSKNTHSNVPKFYSFSASISLQFSSPLTPCWIDWRAIPGVPVYGTEFQLISSPNRVKSVRFSNKSNVGSVDKVKNEKFLEVDRPKKAKQQTLAKCQSLTPGS